MGDGTKRHYKALLIGVSDYSQAENFDDLRGPRNDIDAVAGVLGSPPLGLFSVTSLTDPGHEMRSEVYDFLRNATAKDDLLLYYSGHGGSDDKQQFYLTSTRTHRGASGLGLRYDDLAEWIEDSRARSVVVVLDCCRAGKANQKGPSSVGQAMVDTLDKRQSQQRVRFTLAAVAASEDASDTEDEHGLSPFTERFLDAVRDADPSDDGMVDLIAVHTRLCTVHTELRLQQPPLFGPRSEETVYLARRPAFAEALLRKAGLDIHAPERTGGAVVDGEVIRVPTESTAQVIEKLGQDQPTTVVVGDRTGSGKTWLMCDVCDELAARGWTVLGMRPNTDTPQIDALMAAIRTYVRTHSGTGRTLIAVDGIEWSDAWNQVVMKASTITDTGASLLLNVDSFLTTDWHVPGGFPVPPPGTRAVLPQFIAELIGGGYYPQLTSLPAADRRGYEKDLIDLCGNDLWAAVQLAPFVVDKRVELEAAEALWRDRVGLDADDDVKTALIIIASLSWYGIWAPVDNFTEPGVVVARRLGADFTGSAIRINSHFVRRALIGRKKGEGLAFQLDTASVATRASEWMRMYLKSFLAKPSRHEDAVRMLRSFRLYRHGFDDFVTGMAEDNDLWATWETACESTATVAATLLVVRSSMPPKTMREMIAKLAARIVNGEMDGASLTQLLDCLDVLRTTPGARNDVNFESALDVLDDRFEERLTESAHPVDHRTRLLRLVHRFGDLQAVARLRRLGPLLLKSSTPLVEDDLGVLVSLAHKLTRSGTAEGRELRDKLRQWPTATDLLDQATTRTASRSATFLSRWLVASRIMGVDVTNTPQLSRLKRIVGSVGISQLSRSLTFCQANDPALARDFLDWVVRAKGLRQRMRQVSPVELAGWVTTVAHTHTRNAAQLLRVDQRTVDGTLLDSQEEQIRQVSDRVGCSMVLNTAAKVEDQADLLADGFATQLAARLGTGFLAQQLAREHRPSVAVHLINSFVNADVRLDDEVYKVVVDLVADDFWRSYKERGPTLALAIATSTSDGEKFLTQLRGSPRMKREQVRKCMQNARLPMAVTAFHHVGVLLFPDIVYDYRDYLDQGDMTERTFLRDIRDGTEPVPALEAANAIAGTLLLTGDRDAGDHILSKFDELTGSVDWTRRLLSRVDVLDLPRALALVLRLSPDRAGKLVRESEKALLRKLSGIDEALQVFASLLNTVSRIEPNIARNLVQELQENGTFDVVSDKLMSDLDLFGQVEVLRYLVHVSRRVGAPVLSASTTASLDRIIEPEILRITNPRVLGWYLETVADRGTLAARDLADKLRFDLLRSRFARRRRVEASDTAYLAGLLFDLGGDHVGELLDENAASWLLRNAPIDQLPELVEIVLSRIVSVDAVSLTAARLGVLGTNLFTRDMHEVCQGMGRVAWAIHRFGHTPLDLPEFDYANTIATLPVEDVLVCLAWLASSDWRDDLIDQIFKDWKIDSGWKSTPRAAALCLAASLHLDRTHALWDDDESEQETWRLALSADPRTVRILAGAIIDLPVDTRAAVLHQHGALVAEARERFASGAVSWRTRSTDLLDLLLRPGLDGVEGGLEVVG